MNTFFKKENLKTTILAAVYLVLGILFCSMQVKMFNFVESFLCFVMIIGGVVCISIYALMSSDGKEFKLFIYGIIAVVFGFLMLTLSRFFGIILAIIVGYNGVLLIIQALKEKSKINKQWITSFVIGIIVTALAIVTIILSGTNSAKKILSLFFGIMFLIEGIYDLVQLIMLAVREHKNKKQTVVIPEEDIKVKEENKG